MRKIYKLTLYTSGKEEYYTSLAAMYERHQADEMGVTLSHLWNIKASANGFAGKKIRIEVFTLYSKSQRN